MKKSFQFTVFISLAAILSSCALPPFEYELGDRLVGTKSHRLPDSGDDDRELLVAGERSSLEP